MKETNFEIQQRTYKKKKQQHNKRTLVLPSAITKGKWQDAKITQQGCTLEFPNEIEGAKEFLGYFCCRKYPSCVWMKSNLCLFIEVPRYFMEQKISSAPNLRKLDETKSLILHL